MVVSLGIKFAELLTAAILHMQYFYIKVLHNSFPDKFISVVLPHSQTQRGHILALEADGVGKKKLVFRYLQTTQVT